MSEKDTNEQQPSSEAQVPVAQDDASQGVKRGGKIIGLLILVSLVWYLASDRYTPYTSQARVQGYVIGVAPQVSGIVTEVLVANNERVEPGQPLFKIDSSQYEIALAKAQSDYENAVRQVEAGDAGVEAARANLRAALANLDKAQKDTDRLERLYRRIPALSPCGGSRSLAPHSTNRKPQWLLPRRVSSRPSRPRGVTRVRKTPSSRSRAPGWRRQSWTLSVR